LHTAWAASGMDGCMGGMGKMQLLVARRTSGIAWGVTEDQHVLMWLTPALNGGVPCTVRRTCTHVVWGTNVVDDMGGECDCVHHPRCSTGPSGGLQGWMDTLTGHASCRGSSGTSPQVDAVASVVGGANNKCVTCDVAHSVQAQWRGCGCLLMWIPAVSSIIQLQLLSLAKWRVE